MFRSIVDIHWNLARDSRKSFILGVGKSALSNFWLTLLNPYINLIVPSFFGIMNEGKEFLAAGFFLRTPILNSLSTSLSNVS